VDTKRIRVSEIMTTNVLTLPADMSLREAVTALEAHGISGAPVADERGGGCVGVFSLSNMARAGNFFTMEMMVGPEKPAPAKGERIVGSMDEETVADWMTTDVKSCSATTSVEAAAMTMARAGIHRLLVIDEGKLAGIVSSMDIVRLAAGLARAEVPEPIEARPEATTGL
jgi:CBS domain-containing protein